MFLLCNGTSLTVIYLVITTKNLSIQMACLTRSSWKGQIYFRQIWSALPFVISFLFQEASAHFSSCKDLFTALSFFSCLFFSTLKFAWILKFAVRWIDESVDYIWVLWVSNDFEAIFNSRQWRHRTWTIERTSCMSCNEKERGYLRKYAKIHRQNEIVVQLDSFNTNNRTCSISLHWQYWLLQIL